MLLVTGGFIKIPILFRIKHLKYNDGLVINGNKSDKTENTIWILKDSPKRAHPSFQFTP